MFATRLSSIFAVIALVAALATGAFAAAGPKTKDERSASVLTYSTVAFDIAQADNAHIIIEVTKKGCPTCAAQQPALEEARKKYPDATFLKFDFVDDTDAVKKFKVVQQSTIIVFKGKDEVARIIGETKSDAIIGAIDKGI